MHGRNVRRRADHGRGFTLIELLVAVGILLALMAITLVSVNFSLSSDRIKGTARQVQSYLAGARDRAIYAKSPVGVRLLLDQNNYHQVTGMIYVGSPELYTEGLVTFSKDFTRDDTGRTVALILPRADIAANPTPWRSLQLQELIGPGARMQIPRETGDWYIVSSREFAIQMASGSNQNSCLVLDRPCESLANSTSPISYALELRPGVLPGTEPVSFPQGVVIDLDGSQVPGIWRPTGANSAARFANPYSGQMDIMFSARGVCMGDATAIGQLHLLVADLGDAEKWRRINGRNSTNFNGLPFVPTNNPDTPDELVVENDQVLVTVVTKTGRVTAHPINPYTSTPTNLKADDPYAFAEIGEVANP